MNNKTMLSAVNATLCLSAIHLRINIFKEISEKNVQSKMAAIFSIDRQKGSNCLLDFFYIFNQLWNKYKYFTASIYPAKWISH